MLKAILLDLDGTLLGMNQDEFVKEYLSSLAKKASEYGYEPKRFIKTVWTGVEKMTFNDGSKNNENVFWDTFSKEYDSSMVINKNIFDEYYSNEFENIKNICEYDKNSKHLIKELKGEGYILVLATNPFFPAVATEARMRWAGLDKNDFTLYTTYENSCHCKPNIEYYKDILKTINCKAEECLMVGNDVSEDMIANSIGIKTFLVTKYLINKDNLNVKEYPQGDFDDLLKYIHTL